MIAFTTVGRYEEPCSTASKSCYSPLKCASGLCKCETTQYYKGDDNTCNTRRFSLVMLTNFASLF